MKKGIYSLLLVALFLSAFIGCSGSSSNKDSSKYDRTPYIVYTYEDGKEIVLYTNPEIATVNGQSGSWTDGHETSVNGECLEVQEYYIIWYGSKTCVIWPTKSMIFWGSEREALANLDNEARWTICHKKRM